MKEFTVCHHSMRIANLQLPITTQKDMPWEAKHSPKLTIRAKYEPYDALRQRFWRQYIANYDVDETGTISYTELTAMLDSLASTLSRQTIEGHFRFYGKNPEKDELSIDEVIMSLEREVTKPSADKPKVKHGATASDVQTPMMAPEPAGDGMSTTGPAASPSSPVDAKKLAEQLLASQPSEQGAANGGPGNLQPAQGSGLTVPSVRLERKASVEDDLAGADDSALEPDGTLTPGALSEADSNADAESADSSAASHRERVINIRTCPLCHRPRLGRKSEQDIVTHLAICASNDWSRVDRIVTANYVTSSQAQRKFLTRMMNKVAIGAYSLGANSANILVQDRMTGQLQEEKMAVSTVEMGRRSNWRRWLRQGLRG